MSQKIEKFIDQIMKEFKFYKESWNYEDGCIYIGMEDLYNVTGDRKYYNFIKGNIEKRLNDDGTIKNFSIKEYNIDNICSGRVLYTLYDETEEEKYRKAIEESYDQIRTHPRNREQSFWHKKIYPDQVWLDGLYMALPFYTEYEKRFDENNNLKDIFLQFVNVEKNMKDPETGLYYHGYDESRKEKWADGITGRSGNFWSRAMGWYVMALIDVIEKMGINENRRRLEKIFSEAVDALMRFQDEKSGLWYQVIDKKDNPKNYLETSGSLMIIYSVLKGCRLGVLKKDYIEKAEKGFDEIEKNYLKEKDGEIYLDNICGVAGLGNTPYRDGTEEYYYSERIIPNDYKGVGAFLMAYSEIIAKNK